METQESQSPKIPFYMQRPFGEKMNASFDFIKENWKVLLKYITYLILPVCIFQGLSLNTFFGYYMSAVMSGINGTNMDFDSFGEGFFVSYGFMMLFSFIGYLLITALLYALVKLYNDREDRLVGITFKEIRPLLFRNMGRLFLMGILLMVIIIAFAIVMGIFGALAPLTLILTVPAFFAFFIALSIWPPVYLFENIGLGNSFSKAIRLGFATWGGIFAILFIMGLIASVLQGVISTPWYMTVMVESLLSYSEEGVIAESSFLYNFFVYILAVLFVYSMYLSMTFGILGISYQYAHATEKMDSITVETEIDNFENL